VIKSVINVQDRSQEGVLQSSDDHFLVLKGHFSANFSSVNILNIVL